MSVYKILDKILMLISFGSIVFALMFGVYSLWSDVSWETTSHILITCICVCMAGAVLGVIVAELEP